MKIYTLGSNSFMHKMVAVTDELIVKGFDSFIHPTYRKLVAGEMDYHIKAWDAGEAARVKIEHDYLRQHYAHILSADAILLVNGSKQMKDGTEIENYIGGNVLIEMGQAYVNNKKIFFLNGLSTDTRITYLDEINAMQPICLNGDLENLRKYISGENREVNKIK